MHKLFLKNKKETHDKNSTLTINTQLQASLISMQVSRRFTIGVCDKWAE